MSGDGAIDAAPGGPWSEAGGTPTVPMNPSFGLLPPAWRNHEGLVAEAPLVNVVGFPGTSFPKPPPVTPNPDIGCVPTLLVSFTRRGGRPADCSAIVSEDASLSLFFLIYSGRAALLEATENGKKKPHLRVRPEFASGRQPCDSKCTVQASFYVFTSGFPPKKNSASRRGEPAERPHELAHRFEIDVARRAVEVEGIGSLGVELE